MYMDVSGMNEGNRIISEFFPVELALYIEENGGRHKVLADYGMKLYLDDMKVIMFIQKLEELELSVIE